MVKNNFKAYILEDEPIFFDQLKDTCRRMGLEVIGSSITGFKAFDDVIENGIVPDIMFLDADLPVINTVTLGMLIKHKYPHVKLIFFTYHPEISHEISFTGGRMLERPVYQGIVMNEISKALSLANS